MKIKRLEEVSTNYQNGNSAHFLGKDGYIHCIPISVEHLYGPIYHSWDEYKLVKGNSWWALLQWICSVRLNDDEQALLVHIQYEDKEICHTWKEVAFLYHAEFADSKSGK